MKKILFTGGGGAGNEAIWSALNSCYDLYFADADLATIDPCIPKEKRISIPFATEKNFKDTLKQVSKDLMLDFIVPGVDEELIKFADARDEFDANIFLPDIGFIELMLNKYDCANEILRLGLQAPKTELVKDANLIGYPLIVKPNSGRGSKGVMVINSQKELEAYMVLYKSTPIEELIVQELVIGQEYTVLVSVNNFGELNGIIPIKVEQKKGITIRARIDMNPIVIDYTKSFHMAFTTVGVYNIQCMLTSKGVVLPFEVNPRISTTFCVSIVAGFNPFSGYNKHNYNGFLFSPQDELMLTRNWKNNITSHGSD